LSNKEELKAARSRLELVEYESQKLLDAASIVLESGDFPTAARGVFDIAKELTGAASGYVALLSEDGSENEVLFLDSGGLPCSVDESLPMPIRGLRETAYRQNRPAFENSFMSSEWVKFMPEGHVVMDNVLFGPLIIDGRVEGLIGLANKPSAFTDDDARIVMALSNLVAIGLKKSKIEEELRTSREKLSETISELKLYASLLRHDLSNDLQVIIGELQLAQLKVADEPELKDSCDSITSACSRMLRLLQVFNQSDMIDEENLLSNLSYLIDETKKSYPDVIVTLQNHSSFEDIPIRGRPLLPFVFDNLFRNAIQHSGQDVTIDIYVRTMDNSAVIDFVDDGPGIDLDIASRLFQKGASKTGGGFGLYLCRKIVETYQGRINLLPTIEYGKGAAFRIELPLVKERIVKRIH